MEMTDTQTHVDTVHACTHTAEIPYTSFCWPAVQKIIKALG